MTLEVGRCGSVVGVVLVLSFMALLRSSELFDHNFQMCHLSLGSKSLKTR